VVKGDEQMWLRLWAKADLFHLLACHMMDVGKPMFRKTIDDGVASTKAGFGLLSVAPYVR